MRNILKNYNDVLKYIFCIVLLHFIISCGTQQLYITKIEGKKLSIADKQVGNQSINDYIKPYRQKIDNELSEVLAYNPETLDKVGVWQTSIGNLLADITYEYGNKITTMRNIAKIDFVMLNHGGIRSILPKGNLTMRQAYQMLPFENMLVVINLKSAQIIEMCQYIITEKKPHPLSGLSFEISKDQKPINIKINNVQLTDNQIYRVGTSDYCANGGDNMIFFMKNISQDNLEYKLRNIFIDYLKEIDTVKVSHSQRIVAQ